MPGSRDRHRPILFSYLYARKFHWSLLMLLTIGAVIAVWGSYSSAVPSASDYRGNSVQYWRLLSLGSAILPVLGLASPMAALEEAAAEPYWRLQAVVLTAQVALSTAIVSGATGLAVDTGAALAVARASLAWFGLAMISGRIMGWNSAWILPVGSLCVLLYWGSSSDGGYRWWEFTARPASDGSTAALAGVFLAAGVASYVLSPWRMSRLRGRMPLPDVGADGLPVRSATTSAMAAHGKAGRLWPIPLRFRCGGRSTAGGDPDGP